MCTPNQYFWPIQVTNLRMCVLILGMTHSVWWISWLLIGRVVLTGYNWFLLCMITSPIETIPALLALCAGNSPVTSEFPSQRPVTQSFDVFFDLHLNKRLSKQSSQRWFETPAHSLCCHCNRPLVGENDLFGTRYFMIQFVHWYNLETIWYSFQRIHHSSKHFIYSL